MRKNLGLHQVLKPQIRRHKSNTLTTELPSQANQDQQADNAMPELGYTLLNSLPNEKNFDLSKLTATAVNKKKKKNDS